MNYPNINPIAFSLGPVQVHWYGLMYLFALISAWYLARLRVKNKIWSKRGWAISQVDDLITYGMFGVIGGGRLGYILFYDFKNYLSDPLEILRIWNGGMSFHGGLIGVMVAIYYFSCRYKHSFLEVLDFVAPLVPPGLFFGRIGNFINAELWGKVTQSWIGMVFPRSGNLPRHPSQLYEAILEGLVLFLVLWIYSSKPRQDGNIAGLFALGYGVFRFCVEFVREPDAHLGYLAFGWLTMGQVLCLPLILVGIWLFSLNKHKNMT